MRYTCDPKTCDPKTCDPKTCDPKTCDPKKRVSLTFYGANTWRVSRFKYSDMELELIFKYNYFIFQILLTRIHSFFLIFCSIINMLISKF